jgi:hypothetical protein
MASRFWKVTMSTNLHTLQQQMSEGLTRSMAKCQQIESALKTAQDRNSTLEDRNRVLESKFRELRQLVGPAVDSGWTCRPEALLSILSEVADEVTREHPSTDTR